MKRKGFTLIELVVVVAIILLLAATLAPKLRKEVAKARDAKAVAALGAVRTSSAVFIADKATIPYLKETAAADDDGLVESDDSSEYLETSVVTFLNTTEGGGAALGDGNRLTDIPIGGHRDTATGDVTYGGVASISGNTDGDFNLIESATADASTNEFDTKGNKWAEY